MAIYNGTQKINMSGIGKVYVGSQLVYQSAGWHTIFEGTKTWTSADLNVNRSDWNDPVIETASEYKFRITFTSSAEAQPGGNGAQVYSTTSNPSLTLYNNSPISSSSFATGSATKTDYEFNAFTSETANQMIYISATKREYGGTAHSTYLHFYFDATTKQFWIKSYFDTNMYKATHADLKITKVEQYY